MSRCAAGWRTAVRALAACCAVVCLSLVVAGPASAHAELLRTDPADGAVLATAPSGVRLTFNEPVQVVREGLRIFGPDGEERELTGRAVDEVAVLELPERLERGTWIVAWRVVSQDGHPISGALTFSVGVPSAGTVAPSTEEGPGDLGSLRTGLQSMTYVSALLVAGLVVFAVVVRPASGRDARHRRLARIAGCAASTAALLLVPVTGVITRAGGTGDLIRADSWSGPGASDQLLAWALLSLGLAVGLRAPAASRGRERLRALVVLLAPASFALVGHSQATGPFALVVVSDVTHAVAGAVWLGGLVGLALLLAGTGSPGDRATAVSRFSGLAAGTLAALAGTGALLAWRMVGSWSGLVASSYGRLLLVKLCLVLLAAAIAAWNRWVLVPWVVDPGRQATTASGLLVRTLRAEALVVASAVVVTGALVNLAPESRDPVERAAVTGGPQAHGQLASYHVTAVLEPGRVGRNELVLEIVDATGAAAAGVAPPDVTVRSGGLDLGAAELVQLGDGRFGGVVAIPRSGPWTFQVSLRVSKYANPVALLGVDVPE
jgi:copper transport protein